MAKRQDSAWRSFERAVAAFLQALDPTASVRHDVIVPDIDTNEPRQRDVWIDTHFGGHLKITVLVSCKRKKSKLSQQDIDAFIGELRSSGANKGVLYAYAGYTAPALRKAERLGISCCVLYENRPPDLPGQLAFQSYHFCERYQMEVTGPRMIDWTVLPALLEEPVSPGGPSRLAELAVRYDAAREETAFTGRYGAPRTWRAEIEIPGEGAREPLIFAVFSSWGAFEAKTEAFLLDGSYSFTEGSFVGSLATPAIDRFSAHPGPGWTEVAVTDVRSSGNLICSYATGGDLPGDIRRHFDALTAA